MVVNIKRAYPYILLTVMGGIVFSPFITTLCLNILHLPMVLPEIIIIPFIFLLRNKFRSINFNRNQLVILMGCAFVLLLLAIAVGKYQIGGVFSIFRSYLYLIICYCAFSQYNEINNTDIQFVMLGSLLGWLYDSYSSFQHLIVDFDMSNLTFGMILSIPLFLAITINKRRYISMSMGILIMTGIFIFSGIRRIIAAFLASLVVIFVLQSIGNTRRLVGSILLSLMLVGAINVFLPQIESFVLDVSPQLHYRMFVRTEETLSGNAGNADASRASNITTFFDDGIETFIPHGFYTNHTSDNGAGIYNDMPLRGLTWMLGFPLTLVLLLRFVKIFNATYKNYRLRGSEESFPYLIAFSIIIMMLFLDGSFLSYSYCAPITGLCLGRLEYYSKYY